MVISDKLPAKSLSESAADSGMNEVSDFLHHLEILSDGKHPNGILQPFF